MPPQPPRPAMPGKPETAKDSEDKDVFTTEDYGAFNDEDYDPAPTPNPPPPLPSPPPLPEPRRAGKCGKIGDGNATVTAEALALDARCDATNNEVVVGFTVEPCTPEDSPAGTSGIVVAAQCAVLANLRAGAVDGECTTKTGPLTKVVSKGLDALMSHPVQCPARHEIGRASCRERV